jgi:hypothetical protein
MHGSGYSNHLAVRIFQKNTFAVRIFQNAKLVFMGFGNQQT